MYRNGHYGAALVAYTPIGTVAYLAGFPTLAFAGAALAVTTAMVHDWDQRVPLIAHRGPTHTVWFALAAALVTLLVSIAPARSSQWPTGPVAVIVSTTVFITICSHVAADALTPAGVQPFAPVDDRHTSYDLVKAKNPIANYALLGLGTLTAVAALLGVQLLT